LVAVRLVMVALVAVRFNKKLLVAEKSCSTTKSYVFVSLNINNSFSTVALPKCAS